MKKMLFLLVVLVTFLLSSCVTESYLISSETSGNKIVFENGRDFQQTTTANLSAKAAGRKSDGGYNSVLIELNNTTEEPYSFKDSQISVLGGNKDTDSWKEIGTWDCLDFFSSKVNEAKAAKTAADVIAVLAVLDAVFDPYETISFSSESGTVLTYRYYDPSNAFFTALLAEMVSEETEHELKTNINFLKQTLLFSNEIESNKAYSGLVFFPVDRKYPDYKIVLNDQGECREFVFSRTDREEIIHPWSCDRNRTVFSLTYAHSLLSERMGVDGLWLASKGLGCYVGFYEDYKEEIDSFPFGLTLKCSPHTWLLFGFEVGGHVEDDITQQWLLAPQTGINVSYNWLDCIFKISYDIPSKNFLFDAGLGFSF